MKFLADVNIPLPLINLLRKNGHEVCDAKVEYPKAKDIQLIKIAKENNLVILTRDKDFLELTKYPKYKIPLIAIRLTNQQTINILGHLEDLLNNQSEDILMHSITVINEAIADSFPLEEK
ncbi:DUF5615 family PIN-like protein [Candidatus Daviesbacteria bacterium]|nr:DUF5615 family PIN-like protein [Candidatus Daviesbacteria bacterium]